MRTTLLCTIACCALAGAQDLYAIDLKAPEILLRPDGMTGRTPAYAQLPVSGWPARFQEWMVDMGFLPR